MTLEEAIAQGPLWLQLWLNWLLFGAFILPLTLLIWRPTRLAGIAAIVASVIAAVSMMQMYEHMGYVKLLGLPHIIVWTPLAIYLFRLLRTDLPNIARGVALVILATLLVSLAFDYTDALRYLLGERTPLAMPA
jgi:hypothetical protein